MLEVIAATIIISVALVPALKLTRTVITNTSEIEQAETRLAFCTSKLEEEMARTAAKWDLGPKSGTFPGNSGSRLHFTVSKSDQLADGGIPGALAAIQVTVWNDNDSDGTHDPSESSVTLATKLAKLASYEEEAGDL